MLKRSLKSSVNDEKTLIKEYRENRNKTAIQNFKNNNIHARIRSRSHKQYQSFN